MNLRTLEEEQLAGPATKLKPDQAWPSVPQNLRWVVIESKVLDGERIVLIFNRKDLSPARRAYPENVLYFPPEIEEMHMTRGDVWTIRTLHRVKKVFKGWVVPKNSKPKPYTQKGIAHP